MRLRAFGGVRITACRTVVSRTIRAGEPTGKGSVMRSVVVPLAAGITLAALLAAAANVTVQDLTIANTYNPAAYPQGYAQAVAIEAEGDRQVYSRDRFLGLQDTVLTWEPNQHDGYRQLFDNGFVKGNVDFLCGNS